MGDSPGSALRTGSCEPGSPGTVRRGRFRRSLIVRPGPGIGAGMASVPATFRRLTASASHQPGSRDHFEVVAPPGRRASIAIVAAAKCRREHKALADPSFGPTSATGRGGVFRHLRRGVANNSPQ
jgi:hypothetical protein